MIDERFGEGQPSLDGHGQGDASGAEAESTPKDADAAKVRSQDPSAGHVELQVHLDGAARHGQQVVPRQALEHQRLTLVARRLVPSQNDQSADVTGDAQHVKHGQQRLQ